MRAVISASYPILIQPFISTEETRYYLNGFYVHPDPNQGLRIVATDGHRLGVFYDREGIWKGNSDEGFIVKLDKNALSMLKQSKTSRGTSLPKWLIVEDKPATGVATIVEGDAHPKGAQRVLGTFHDVLVDGTFPEYHRIIPPIRSRKIVPASYNARYLADFAKIFERTVGSIRVMSATDNGPAIVLTSRTDFFGVLMPMRASAGNEEKCTFPHFWTKQPEIKRLPPPSNVAEPQPEPKPEPVPEHTAEVITLTPRNSSSETDSEPAAA